MKQQDALELHELLFSFIGLFHERCITAFRRHDSALPGLKKNHFKILGQLTHRQSLTSSEIGRLLDIEKGSVTALIDQLEAHELVIRRYDPFDRRKSQISLSEEGQNEMKNIVDMHTRELEVLFSCIEEQDLQRFLESMRYSVALMKNL